MIYYDDPSSLADESNMRLSVGILVQMRNSTCEKFFEDKGYKQVELPRVTAVKVTHPMRLRIGLQFMIAVMRAYPKLFDFFEMHAEKYKNLLAGQKTVMIELYRGGENPCIEFYCPVENAKKFWLTKLQAPELAGE